MAKKIKPARAQLPLRIPELLLARIKKAANRAGMSMNAEIAYRLAGSFEMETRFGGPLATALVERMGQAMAALGEGYGFYEAGKTGHGREWLHYVIPYDRAAAAAVAVLKINRPAVDGAVPTRSAVEDIERSGVEAVERIGAEVEHQAQLAASDGPAPSTEPAAMWDRAIRKSEVLHGLAPAAEAATPAEVKERIQRVSEDLGALFALLKSLDLEDGK